MRGFTLIELIVALAVLGSFLGLGIPAMHNLIERHDSQTAYFSLRRTLQQARIQAQDQLTDVTVCPMKGTACLADWSAPIHVFTDLNFNQTLDEDETLLFIAHIDTRFGYWQKTKAKQNYVRFNPLGHAFSSASTFLYCPYSDHDNLAKSIVISFQGRIRTGQYLSSRGTPYAQFSNMNCN